MDELDLGSTIRGFVAGQKVFGRYTLKRILGRGGMGVVWLAQDESLDREVALKFLPEVVAADPRAVDDLKRETRRSLQLTHPHIVRIYDFIEDARTAAIAMEYVAGDTLAKRALAQPERVFSPEELRPWVEQLCGALDYAHTRARIVHRDLKPANLMIDAQGDLKIADFGIAASVSDSVSRVSAQAGSSGTPVYMSPQQMMGERPAVTDDVYALGATLYDLLTGRPPFYTGNILVQVQNKVPPSIAARREELGITAGKVPEAWEKTIAACLAKDPAERPQSAGEVWARLPRPSPVSVFSETDAVARLAREETVAMDPPKLVESPRPAPSITRWMGAAVMVAAVAVAGWWWGVAQPARRAEEAEAARLANARGGLLIRTEPVGADVRVGGVGTEKSPAAFNELRLGDQEVTVERAGYEPATLKLTVEENKLTQPPVIVLRPLVGAAEITSIPEGVNFELRSTQLVADGAPAVVRTGATPAKLADLPIGDYRLVTRLKDWPERTQSLKIETVGVARAVAQFEGGSLAVLSEPVGLEFEVKPLPGMPAGSPPEVLKGRSPARFENLSPGKYAVTYRRPGWPDQTRGLEIAPGKETRMTAEFVPGAVMIESSPSGAQVLIDGNVIGKTPLRIPEVTPGTLSVELRLEGFAPRTLTGAVVARQELKLSARLEGQRNAAEVKSALQRGALAHFPLRTDPNDLLGKNSPAQLSNTRFENGGLFLNGQYGKYSAAAKVPALDYDRFTVAVDFYPVGLSLERQWFLVGGSFYRWIGLGYSGGQVRLTLNNQDTNLGLGGKVQPRAWHTLICSVDLAQRKIFVLLDGELMPPVELPAGFRLRVVNSQDEKDEREFVFANGSTGEAYHGYVANLRVYNFAVPASDLRTMYDLILPERPR